MPTRSYHAPNRIAAADRTRKTILASAKVHFEDLGWSRTTIPAIAGGAGVSPKTVEAPFGTEANLLAEVVAAVTRVDADAEASRLFQDAPSAIAALPHHAAYAAPLVAGS